MSDLFWREGGVVMNPLLSVRDLKVHFPVHGGLLMRRIGAVKAVEDRKSVV